MDKSTAKKLIKMNKDELIVLSSKLLEKNTRLLGMLDMILDKMDPTDLINGVILDVVEKELENYR